MQQAIQLERVRPRSCTNPNGNTETRWRVFHEGELLGTWRVPMHAAARVLVGRGVSRDAVLVVYRGSTLCMRGGLGWFADRSISETDAGGLRIVKWRPRPDFVSGQPLDTADKIA